MTGAIGHWHDLLGDGGLAEASAAMLGHTQHTSGLAFGDRPLCSVLRPRFISPATYREVCEAGGRLLAALRTVDARAAGDARFREQFRLNGWEELLIAATPRPPVSSPLSRLDLFLDPHTGIPRLTEINAETPAGPGYGDVLAEIFMALPVMHRFTEDWRVTQLHARPNLIGTLLDCWHSHSGRRTMPSVAIIDWDHVPTTSEFRICRDYLASHGVPCRITTPEAVEYRNGELVDSDGERIDLIYKRVLLHELAAAGGTDHPVFRAARDGAVCMVNGIHCKPLHKKASLAVLSDERNRSMFSPEQAAAIDRHVPWTRVVEERITSFGGNAIDLLPWIAANREELVLKPNDDYGGAGIVLGWEVADEVWQAAIGRAVGEPYIVQQRIALPEEPFPVWQDGALLVDRRIVDLAPFGWQGKWVDGALTRISTSTLVNVTAGGGSTVPTLVAEPR